MEVKFGMESMDYVVLTNLRSSWNFWLYGFSVVAENTAVTATKMENWPLVFKMWESN